MAHVEAPGRFEGDWFDRVLEHCSYILWRCLGVIRCKVDGHENLKLDIPSQSWSICAVAQPKSFS